MHRHVSSDRRSRRPTRHDLRRRRGAYAVEFAVCVPVLFITFFGCFDLARFMYVRQALDQSAYEAARQGVLAGGTVANVTTKADQLLSAYGIANATVTVVPTAITKETTEVTVTINCTFSENSWVSSMFLDLDAMTSTVTLDHENQAFLVPSSATAATELNENEEPLDE